MSVPIRRLWYRSPVLAAGMLTFLVTTPVWRMGWLRDDWFFLWWAVDPDTAPPGAVGVFPRPAAMLIWKFSALVAGDATWAMHVLMVVAWLALAAGVLRWHRHWGGSAAGGVVAVVLLVAHGALAEPRLWASAGNGVVAAALAIWGVWLMGGAKGDASWRALGGAVLALAVVARADAVLLVCLPLAAGGRRSLVGWIAGAVAGVLLLFWMVSAGGEWTLQPEAGGRLLRLLLVPWGPPLPNMAAGILGILGLAGAAAIAWRTNNPRVRALATSTAGLIAAGSLAGWTPAGRYVLMPTVALALLVGRTWDAIPGRRIPCALLLAYVGVHLSSAWFGGTTQDLLQRSDRETRLYRTVQAAGEDVGDRLVVIDPPPLGWTNSAADLENVVSAAARQPVAVAVRPADVPIARGWSAVAWEDGGWRWQSLPQP